MKMTDDLNDTSIALKRGRAADYVRQTLREIHISKPMLDLIDRMATAPGLPKEIDGAWLRKKWQSEVLCVNNGIINLQGLSPDIAFQNWSIDKLDNPRGLLRKSIQKASQEIRHDHVSYFQFGRWDQENACAERMRGSEDDEISLMAALWLRQSLREQSKFLTEMLILYSGRISRNGLEKQTPDWLKYSPDEIRCWTNIPPTCQPLWLDHAKTLFGEVLKNLPRKTIERGANKSRLDRIDEVRTLRLRLQSERVANMDFYSMPGPLEKAAKLNITANEFLLAQKIMCDDILDGKCDISIHRDQPVWMIFAKYLSQAKGKIALPDFSEVETRIQNIFNLDIEEFISGLPPLSKGLFLQGSDILTEIKEWSLYLTSIFQVQSEWHNIPSAPDLGFVLWLAKKRWPEM